MMWRRAITSGLRSLALSLPLLACASAGDGKPPATTPAGTGGLPGGGTPGNTTGTGGTSNTSTGGTSGNEGGKGGSSEPGQGGSSDGGPTAPTGPIDFSIWQLQLPTGSGNSPTTIQPKELVAGFSNPYFFKDADGAQIFMSPAQGITTPGSQHCRTEMREMNRTGGGAGWDSTGTNTMTVEGKVSLAGGGKGSAVAVGQLFIGTDSIPLCELVWSSGKGGFQVFYEEAKSNGSTIAVDAPAPLNTKYTFQLALSKGVLTVTVNDKVVYTRMPSADTLAKKFYFKVGNYDQKTTAGTPDETPFTTVAVYKVDVVHQ